MLDKAEAFEILGVNKNASRTDIEKKYYILLKKHRAADSQEENSSAEQVDFEKITSAYNLLMGYEEPQTEVSPKKPNALYKKLGIDEKKANNFLYYYKFHILGGIILLITLIFTIRGCVTRVEPDFMTAFIGKIPFSETDALNNSMKAGIPEIKEPGFDGAYLTGQANSEQDYAMQTKAVVLFAAQSVDLFVLDKENFDKYAKKGAFISLDDIAVKLGTDKEKNKEYVLKAEETDKEHLYGIDISNSKALKDSGIAVTGDKLVAAVSVSCKQQDKAIKVLEFLLK